MVYDFDPCHFMTSTQNLMGTRGVCVWTRTWQTADEVRETVLAFVKRYNQHWLIERHGHRSPSVVRAGFRTTVAA
jgi:hypothetical protein